MRLSRLENLLTRGSIYKEKTKMIQMKFRRKGRIEEITVAHEDCPDFLVPPEGKDGVDLTGFPVIFVAGKNEMVTRLKMGQLPAHVAKIGCAGGARMFREVYFFDFPEDVKLKIRFEKSENFPSYERERKKREKEKQELEVLRGINKEIEEFNKKNAPWEIEYSPGGFSYPASIVIHYRKGSVQQVDLTPDDDIFLVAKKVFNSWLPFISQIEEVLEAKQASLERLVNEKELSAWKLQGRKPQPRFMTIIFKGGRQDIFLE